jgi:hypothetical protein
MRKLKNAADSGITTRKIIVVPCMVNNWLNVSADTTCSFGPFSCHRMIDASRPPIANQASAVYMYSAPIRLWSTVVSQLQSPLFP